MSAPFTTAAPLAGVAHGFFGRRGGVSTGELASLNCGLGSGDDPALIAENRRRVADAVLPGAALAGVYQVHGHRCVTVDGATDLAARPEADALATRTPGILLGILTADCVPILFADREAGVVGAAHAGWKGAIAGVAEATLDAMSRARWVGRIGRGWVLIRDAGEVSVADIYHQFVFRTGARIAARQSGQELDRLAHELAGGIEESLKLPLEKLFRKAAAD